MPTSTPSEPKSNGLIERMIRRVKDGTRTNLVQSGLDITWWPHAAMHFCDALNMEMHEGNSAYNRRHGEHCTALNVPFGMLVDFMPSTGTKVEPSGFAPKAIKGLFLGYHIQPGGKWSGDYYVVAWSDLRDGPDCPPIRMHH